VIGVFTGNSSATVPLGLANAARNLIADGALGDTHLERVLADRDELRPWGRLHRLTSPLLQLAAQVGDGARRWLDAPRQPRLGPRVDKRGRWHLPDRRLDVLAGVKLDVPRHTLAGPRFTVDRNQAHTSSPPRCRRRQLAACRDTFLDPAGYGRGDPICRHEPTPGYGWQLRAAASLAEKAGRG
jgi:hypothetical protein